MESTYYTYNDSTFQDNYTYLFSNDTGASDGSDIRIVDDWTKYPWVRALIVCAYILVIVVGTIGNLVVLVTGCQRRRRTAVYTVFIINLALCDLYRVLVDAPLIKLLFINLSISDELQNASESICSAGTYVTIVFGASSVWTMFAISLERYIAICHPFKYQRVCTINRARIVVVVIWILCAVSLFPLVGMMVNTVNVIKVAHDLESAENGDVRALCVYVMATDSVLGDLYYVYLFLIFATVPLACIIVAYSRVFYNLYKSMEYFEKTHASKKQMDKRKKIAKMMLCILIVFVVCWVPYITFLGFAAFGGNMHRDNILFMYAMVTWFMFLGSAINPYIYSYYSRDFRYNLLRIIFCCHEDSKVARCLAGKLCCCCFDGRDYETYMRSVSTRSEVSEFHGSSSDDTSTRIRQKAKTSTTSVSFIGKIASCTSKGDNAGNDKVETEIASQEPNSTTPMVPQINSNSKNCVKKRDRESSM